MRAAGLSGFFRTVAGAAERTGRWRLRRPISVALLADAIFAVDSGAGQVYSCRKDGSHAQRLSLPEGFVPVAVAASSVRGEVFVADGPTGEVLVFTAAGRFSRRLVPAGVLSRCGGIAAAFDGGVLLTDVAAGAVIRAGPMGDVVARVGRRGAAAGEFNFPTSVVEAPDGSIWVLDSLNFRVQHLDSRMEPLGAFGQLGDGTGHFALPKGLAMDGEGHLYVSDARFDNIQVFDQVGRLLFVAGERGSGPGQYWTPAGLAFGADGVLAVADSGNQRVQLLQFQRRIGARRG